MLQNHKRKNYSFANLFGEFGVTTEKELQEKLSKDSQLIPCICCGKQFPIEKIRIINCNPYCLNCI